MVGRLISKVTLSGYDRRQGKAVGCRHSIAMAARDQRRTGGGHTRPTGLFRNTVNGVAALDKGRAIVGAPRLLDGAPEKTERHLTYQAAH